MIFGGMLAGFINGFLGTGGGIILIFLLSALRVPDESGRLPEERARDDFATVIAVIIPLSLISSFIYSKNVPFSSAEPYLFAGMLGGAAGALLLDRISTKWLKKIFALMVVWAGICFLTK